AITAPQTPRWRPLAAGDYAAQPLTGTRRATLLGTCARARHSVPCALGSVVVLFRIVRRGVAVLGIGDIGKDFLGLSVELVAHGQNGISSGLISSSGTTGSVFVDG